MFVKGVVEAVIGEANGWCEYGAKFTIGLDSAAARQVIASSSLSLSTLRRDATRVYREGGGSRPDVFVTQHEGRPCVLKDFGACDPWFAFAFGRLLAAREARALKDLDAVRGVPRLLGRAGAKAVVMEHVEAAPVLKADHPVEWPVFFASLNALVQDFHANGVAHCDLRSPHNVLVNASSEAFVVDLAGAWRRGGRLNFVSAWLFRQLAGVDRSAITKMKRRCAPDLISADEQAAVNAHHPLEGPARAIGKGVRRVARAMFTTR